MKKNDFVAIDFEHATTKKGTVCSVGIAVFSNGKVIDTYSTLIQPPSNEYDNLLMNKHHISAIKTQDSPVFTTVFPEIYKRINNQTVVAHGAFHTDKHCLEQAMEMNHLDLPLNLNWVCTQNICCYRLDYICKVCGIELNHHESLSDAIACGKIYQLYLNDELPSISLLNENYEIWQKEHPKKEKIHYPKSLKGDVLKPDFEHAINSNNLFFKKKVVISGFSDNDKDRIANEVKLLGGDIDRTVGKNTNILIAGEKVGPSKWREMKEKIAAGQNAQIISYDDYKLIIEKCL